MCARRCHRWRSCPPSSAKSPSTLRTPRTRLRSLTEALRRRGLSQGVVEDGARAMMPACGCWHTAAQGSEIGSWGTI
eukprot:328031-Rhodomonas_salina.1